MDLASPFLVSEARAAGATPKQLRAGRFAAPAHGVRVLRAAVDDDRLVLDALALVARDDHCFSHTTAAALHGMPLPARTRAGEVHVAAPTAGSRMRRRGVVGHRLRTRVESAAGLPVTSRIDTFVHLATLLDHGSLVAVADWLVSHRRGAERIEPADLLAHCERRRGAPRIAAAVAAVRDCAVGSESPRETRHRLLLKDLGLPTAELNLTIFDEDGTFLMRLDGGWPELRAGWEYDGEQHWSDPQQRAKDLDRLERPQALGWRIRKFGAHHHRPEGRAALSDFVAEVRARAAAAATTPIALRGFWSPCLAPDRPRR
ncbi:hypothetical protein [Agrococcus terreus]|uniref:Transcriptional regulator, AbiEi antitoxin, Type IV TA system n=1 Tax=Agrococcus terreus TaxID=574649 RepID=A0ABQ2KFI7_9MICO|nr:hypothetical protein [Agrococcus terreus]GGN80285.1 hypothetical protein GCM10010968_07980 [Agrococcus terreus]